MFGNRAIRMAMACGVATTQLMAWAQTPVQRGKPPAGVPLNAPIQSVSTASKPVPAPPLTPAQRPARHAEIVFVHGQLSVTAENASLNQILREIGRQTGIVITGGVAEERVFGRYGPKSPSDLLATLLDGTGSNMLLIPGEDGLKGQLILTPRHGGPTPPNPNAPGFDDDTATDNDGVERFRQPNSQGVNLFGATPQSMGANGATVTPAGTDQQAPGNTVNPQSPNGVKTPQEIFQQLQLLRQQQQQQAPPETPQQ